MNSPEEIRLDSEWVRQRERVAAWLRLGFAILAIVVIQLNPSRVARFPTLSTATLVSYLIYSATALWLVRNTKITIESLGPITTALDTIWVAFLVISTGGTRTPFFFYYSFPILTASMRWGLKGSLPVAIFGVVVYAGIRLTLAAEAMAQPLGLDTLVVRSSYLVMLAIIFGYISEFEKRQNHKLIALSRTAAQVATLQERRRIMFELHDSILQSLATLILRAESCRKQLSESEKRLDGELGEMEDLTRHTMREIRQFLAGKESQPIAPGSLMKWIKEELRFLQDDIGIKIVLETVPDDINLPQAIETEVYFVLKEGLTNITRHSHASQVSLRINQNQESLDTQLVDNGIGLNWPPAKNGSGVGLDSMRERIEKLRGIFSIEPSTPSGTRISFSIPLSA